MDYSDSNPLSPIEKALKKSLSPTEFPGDVYLYAFSRRTVYTDGTVVIDNPLPIVAIGSVLKETEHFSKLLTSGFAEARATSSNAIPQYAQESEYDYESDSDLDDFEELDDTRSPIAGSSSKGRKGKGKADKSDTAASEVTPKRHHILIPSVAHRTLQACIFYLYTGRTNFLPLMSEEAAQKRSALLTTDDAAPACSPKSMYRLAGYYGMAELQERAFDAIVLRLRPDNLVQESFTSFFARYDRLREHAVSRIVHNCPNKRVQEGLSDAIDKIMRGELPHADGILRSLLGVRLAMSSSISPQPRPPRTSPLVPLPICPPSPMPLWAASSLSLPASSVDEGTEDYCNLVTEPVLPSQSQSSWRLSPPTKPRWTRHLWGRSSTSQRAKRPPTPPIPPSSSTHLNARAKRPGLKLSTSHTGYYTPPPQPVGPMTRLSPQRLR